MKQDIENIIRTNLPEKKKVIVNMLQDDELYNERGMDGVKGFNQALSQINTSLIADEVLKVVVEKIREKIEDLPTLYNSIEHLIAKDDILDLLDNLSPNKENK